jgi:hypothetical protein
MRGLWLLVIGIILLLLFFTLREREQCPSPDDIWVMSDGSWVCIKKGEG